jgi:hypothetical protein
MHLLWSGAIRVNNRRISFTARLIELKNFDLSHQPYIIRYPSVIHSPSLIRSPSIIRSPSQNIESAAITESAINPESAAITESTVTPEASANAEPCANPESSTRTAPAPHTAPTTHTSFTAHTAPTTYAVPPSHQEELISSIRQYGLLYPIIVQEGEGEEILIVHGARRFSACQCIGWHDIPCQVIPPTVDWQEVYQFSLSIFLSHQKPNIIEQARIIQKLKTFLSEDEVIKGFLPRIGLPAHRKVFSRINQLAELEEEIAHDLAVGEADPQLGWRILKLPPAARLPMYRFLCQIPFTLSQKFEVLEYVQEVSYRDSSSLEELLAHPAILDILASDLDLRQKANSIRLFWRARRYPRLTALEEEFAERKKLLHLPEHLDLYPPHHFEHGSYKFELRFADCAELQQELDLLDRLVAANKLDNIIKS